MTREHFVSIVEPLNESLYRFALWKTQNVEDSQDLVQDVILKLWINRDKLSQYEKLEGFAFKILRGMCIDLHRKNSFRAQQKFEINQVYSMNLYLDQKEKLEVIHKEVENLSITHQTIFFLRNIEGLEIKEIAKIMDMKKNTVEVNLSRIRIKLLTLLEKNWYGEK